jgi:predicted PurR-regulated permease PerM
MSEDRNRLLGTEFTIRAARWGLVAWSAIGVLALAYIIFDRLLYPIRIIFPPLIFALIIVYLLNPLVTWMTSRGVPRILAALATYVVLLGALGVGLRYLIPVLVDQVEGFTRSFPDLLSRAQASVADFLQRLGIAAEPGTLFEANETRILDVAGRLLDVTAGLVNVALILVLGLILGFYLLVDTPKIQRGAVSLIPARRRPEVLGIFKKLGRAVGGFVRGQLLVALFVGVASTLALYIVGLPYWAVVGMVSGLFNLIPLIGPFIGGGVAVFIAFTTQTAGEGLLQLRPGWPLAIGSAIALLAVQQLDNHIVSPNIVARTVRLHPVTVMLALLAGGTLLGLWGMLLAVPMVASIKVLILHAWDTQMTWPPAPTEDGAPPEDRPPPSAATGEAPSTPTGSPPGIRGWLERWRRRGPASRPSPSRAQGREAAGAPTADPTPEGR